MMILSCSHLVFATTDVARMCAFFRKVFETDTRFENPEFAEFVLPSGFRVAFFRATGKAGLFFDETAARGGVGIGITVPDVDALHGRVEALGASLGLTTSGPPREHPWGEKSFLLIDPDGNRWEVTQSPTPEGSLVDR